jgi:hypothetical protein
VFYPGLANDRDPLHELRPDYLLITRVPARLKYWNRVAPKVILPTNEVARYVVGTEPLVLYRIPQEASLPVDGDRSK